jgi:hypothetical protein
MRARGSTKPQRRPLLMRSFGNIGRNVCPIPESSRFTFPARNAKLSGLWGSPPH